MHRYILVTDEEIELLIKALNQLDLENRSEACRKASLLNLLTLAGPQISELSTGKSMNGLECEGKK
jgi:hypothetical protein